MMPAMSDSLVKGVDFAVVWCDDFDAATSFYGDVLGLQKSQKYGDLPGQEFETGNLTIAVMQADAFGSTFAPSTHPLALRVEDIAAATATLEAKGVTFVAPAIDSGVCHMAFLQDPAGNALMLHQRYAPR